MQKLLTAILVVLSACSMVGSSHASSGQRTQGASVNLVLGHGIFCDPGCGSLLSLHLENRGPDVASHVVLEFEIPADARLYELSIDYPHRVTRPASGEAGSVTIEFESLPAASFVSIDAYCSNPLEEGWRAEVEFRVRADEVDASPEDNTYTGTLSNPYKPIVAQIRELSEPYRIEITGSLLATEPFGQVAIGSCEPKYIPRLEVDVRGERLILLGGRALRKQFPLGKPVTIQIVNSGGGVLYTTFTRRRS